MPEQKADRAADLGSAIFRIGQAYLADKMYDLAKESFKDAARFGLKYAEPLFELGLTYLIQEKQYDHAIDCFDTLIGLGCGGMYQYRGQAYAAKRQHYEAIADYTEAIRYETAGPHISEDRMRYLRELAGIPADAELPPQEATLYEQRSKAFKAISNDAQAVADYLRYLDLMPPSRINAEEEVALLKCWGDEFLEHGEYGEAIQCLLRASQLVPPPEKAPAPSVEDMLQQPETYLCELLSLLAQACQEASKEQWQQTKLGDQFWKAMEGYQTTDRKRFGLLLGLLQRVREHG